MSTLCIRLVAHVLCGPGGPRSIPTSPLRLRGVVRWNRYFSAQKAQKAQLDSGERSPRLLEIVYVTSWINNLLHLERTGPPGRHVERGQHIPGAEQLLETKDRRLRWTRALRWPRQPSDMSEEEEEERSLINVVVVFCRGLVSDPCFPYVGPTPGAAGLWAFWTDGDSHLGFGLRLNGERQSSPTGGGGGGEKFNQ